jgi:hypothetical protein
MQYKRCVIKHGIEIPEEEDWDVLSETEDDDIYYETECFEEEDKEEEVSSLFDWFKGWFKREQSSENVRRIAKR